MSSLTIHLPLALAPTRRMQSLLAPISIACAVVMTLAVQGYQFGTSNHTVYLLDALRHVWPGLLRNDWFTTRTFQYHELFGVIARELMRAGILAPAFLFGYIGLVIALHVAWWRIVRVLGGGVIEFIVSQALFQLAAAGTGLGMYLFLQDSSFLPSNISAVALLWAIALWLERQPIACGLALAIAAAFHLNYAPLVILLWTFLQWIELRRRPMRERFNPRFWIATAFAIIPAAVSIALALGTIAGRSRAMPLGEFVDLYVRLRHPHHYDPSSWPAWLWICFLWPMPGAIGWWIWQRRAGRTTNAREYAARIFVILSLLIIAALIGAGLTYLSEELIQASLFRFSVFVKMLACVGTAFALREAVARYRLERAIACASLLLIMLLVAICIRRGPYMGLYRLSYEDPRYEAACDWIRDHTPVDAVFIVPPNEEVFRLRAQRAIVVNFKGVPQLSGELGEWRDRLQDVLDLPDLRVLPHSYDGALHAMRDRYHEVDPQHLADAAHKYNARYIVADHRFGPAWEPCRVEMDGNRSWFLYDLSRQTQEKDAGTGGHRQAPASALSASR